MIPIRQLYGCMRCNAVFHIHFSNKQQCPHCGAGLHLAQRLEWSLE